MPTLYFKQLGILRTQFLPKQIIITIQSEGTVQHIVKPFFSSLSFLYFRVITAPKCFRRGRPKRFNG